MSSRPPRRGIGLSVLGAINWDTTIFVDKFAAPGEEVTARGLEEGPGGKGANTAVAAARILGGGVVAFLGALGKDAAAPRLSDSLGVEGIRTEGVVTIKGAETGRAIIVVNSSGGKIIHTRFGANDLYSPVHVRTPASSSILAASKTVVIMDVPLAAARAASESTGGSSRMIYSPGVRSAEGGAGLESVIERADDIVLDRSELAKLSGVGDPRRGIELVQARFPGLTVVATLGPEGCLISRAGVQSAVPPTDLADMGLTAVNSTGSGDAFLAAYASYTMMGQTPEAAARWGNLAGALKASRASTRGSPRRKELEDRMAVLGIRGRRRG